MQWPSICLLFIDMYFSQCLQACILNDKEICVYSILGKFYSLLQGSEIKSRRIHLQRHENQVGNHRVSLEEGTFRDQQRMVFWTCETAKGVKECLGILQNS